MLPAMQTVKKLSVIGAGAWGTALAKHLAADIRGLVAELKEYDPALAKKILAEEGYPNGFELEFANTALPGTQFMVDIGTAIADIAYRRGIAGKPKPLDVSQDVQSQMFDPRY